MAPLSFLILTFVLLFAAANDLLFHEIPNCFTCPEMIGGVVYRHSSKTVECVRDGRGMDYPWPWRHSSLSYRVWNGAYENKSYGGLKW
jgi:hypothetical protein